MKTVDREKLWEEYQKKKTPELREKLIIEYSPLVKLVAAPFLVRLLTFAEFILN